MESLADMRRFWARQDPRLCEAVAPYLWWPTSTASVERSFSLAGTLLHTCSWCSIYFQFTGIIDSKNRQKMGQELRETAVLLFCNGDQEERFTKSATYAPPGNKCVLSYSFVSGNEDRHG